MRARLIGAVLIVGAFAPAGAQQVPPRPSAMAPEGITPIALGLAGYAKVLCSAVCSSPDASRPRPSATAAIS